MQYVEKINLSEFKLLANFKTENQAPTDFASFRINPLSILFL